MQQMSKKQEAQMVSSVEDMISKVAEGSQPTDALVKVAESCGYNPQQIRRVAEAYNQSKTLHHLKTASSSAKLDVFKLANPDTAIETIYPSKYESAGSEKQAALAVHANRTQIPNLFESMRVDRSLNEFALKTVCKQAGVMSYDSPDDAERDRKLKLWYAEHHKKPNDGRASVLARALLGTLAGGGLGAGIGAMGGSGGTGGLVGAMAGGGAGVASALGHNEALDKQAEDASCCDSVEGTTKIEKGKVKDAPKEQTETKIDMKAMYNAESAAKTASYNARNVVNKLSDNVRTNFAHSPFYKLESDIHRQYGKEAGAELAGLLWTWTKAAKLNQRRATARELDYSNGPMHNFSQGFGTVEQLVESAEELHKRAEELHKLKEKAAEHKALTEKSASDKEGRSSLSPFFSKAGFFDLTRSVYSAGKDTLDKIKPDSDNALAGAVMDFEDPDHRDAMRQVKIQAMLNDFLTNDEILAERDPDEVLDYFNQIQDLHPEIAVHPAMMRAWLRQAVEQGGLPAFEAGSIVQQGKSLETSTETARRASRISELTASAKRPNLTTVPNSLTDHAGNIGEEVNSAYDSVLKPFTTIEARYGKE